MWLQGFVGSEFTVFIKIIFVQLEASVMWTGRRERRLLVLLCTPSNLTQKHDQGVLQTHSSLPGNSINPTAPPPFLLSRAAAGKGSWQIHVSCST